MNEAAQWAPTIERIVSQGLFGMFVALVVFVYGLMREHVVLGTHYRAALKTNDELRGLVNAAEESARETRQILAELSRKLEGR